MDLRLGHNEFPPVCRRSFEPVPLSQPDHVLLGTARSPAVCPRAQICVAKELSGDRVREIFDSFRRPAAWHYGSGRTVVHLDLNALNAESQQACVAIPGAGER
jgi:hypothetical protein